MNKPKFFFDTVMMSFLDHLLVLSSTNKNYMNDMVQYMKDGAMITLVRPTRATDSNWREARNLLLDLKRAAQDHPLRGLEIFIFTYNTTAVNRRTTEI